MADDTTKTGRADRDRINVSQDYELDDWARKFGVSAKSCARPWRRSDRWPTTCAVIWAVTYAEGIQN